MGFLKLVASPPGMGQYITSNAILRYFSSFVLLAAHLAITIPTTFAQDNSALSSVSTALDTLAPSIIEEYHLPGATIGVIHRDSVLYLRGFGYADINDNRRVSVDSTLFRLASISKTFTAVAVMQLAEQAKVDLYADINNYLPPKLKMEPKFRNKVTLYHLLTHTAGFDDRYVGKVSRNPFKGDSLGTFLEEKLPERIYPPGLLYSYSNFGVALAGHIVERVSGLSFADYLKRHILDPLGMTMSGMHTDSLILKQRAVGYLFENGQLKELPYDYIQDAPAGQIYASPSDMILYMQTLLNNGNNLHGRILDSASVAFMQHKQFTHHPKLEGGVGMAFHVGEQNGYRTVRHDGGYMGTRTSMTLVPETGTGWFIATTRMDSRLIDEVNEFLNRRLLPEPIGSLSEEPEPKSDFIDVPIGEYTGTYRNTRFPHQTIGKIAVLGGAVGGEMQLTHRGDTLVMPKYGSDTRRLMAVDPLLFKSLDDDYYLAFGRGLDRNISYAFTSGTTAMEKVPWYYAVSFQQVVLGFGLLLQMLLLMSWGGAAIIRHYCKQTVCESGRYLRIAAQSTVLLNLGHIVGFFWVFMILVPRHELMSGVPYGLPMTIYPVQLLSYLAMAGALLWGAFLVLAWFRRQMHWGIRILYTLALAGTIIYLWALEYWNMIGLHVL